MRRIKNLVIGGIENKIFNLILFTVLLLSAANIAVYLHHSAMLSQLAADSGQRQQQAIGETTSEVMDQVVFQTLQRNGKNEARMADEIFARTGSQVTFIADYAAKVFAEADSYAPKPYAGPDPKDDGVWKMKVIYADGVDPSDPALSARIGLVANMSDMMIDVCRSFGAATVYIALPEGVHISVSDMSSSWFEDGKLISYDPRQRNWYQQAVSAGGLIFTEGEWDAINTDSYCIECAAPVYGPDGTLAAVVGADLYLDDMQAAMQEYTVDGEYQMLVNSSGRAVIAPQAERFPLAEGDRQADLRTGESELLARVVSEAIEGNDTGVQKGELADGGYYVAAMPIQTTGWVLVCAYSQEGAARPVTMLQEQNRQIQAEATELYREKTGRSKTTAIILLAAVTLLTLAGAMVQGKRIVKPLNTITRRISELSESNLEFKMEDAYRTGDEVEELAQSFADISHRTVGYLDTVRRVSAEKERISTELGLATQIQAAMLPHIVPAFPDRTDFDIIGSMDPAKEVGGDFYDYFLVDDDHLCMVMADVSGKGVPAALFMMASKIILQSVAMLGKSPAEILTKANEAICSNNEAQMFVTVWLGILELSTGRLTAANAGHEYPVLMRPNGAFELFKDRHGFVIGGMDGVRYREYQLQLEPGAKLFVYTDGVPEATNDDKELFGTDRMMDALNGETQASPQQILKNVRRAVDAFVGGAEQFDDLTMLCMEYKGQDHKEGHRT